MDFHLKQWRNQQHESEEEQEELLHQQQHSAKIPKLLIGNITTNSTQYHKPEISSVSPLPLFAVPPESDPQQQHPKNPNKLNFSPPTSIPSSRLPRMGSGYFSLAQWQELELQALIFRYMLAGATVPSELLNPIRKSLTSVLNLNTPSQYFLNHHHHQYYPHYLHHQQQPAWYWGRAAMDPEPGRCRRTDGKKWRCSRDVVVGQKYCERHMHRGRHRSRKPVETPSKLGGAHFALSGKVSSAATNSACTTTSGTNNNASSITSIDVLRLGQSSLDVKHENSIDLSGEAKSDGHVLRHFFDDWPRSHQESDNVVTSCNNTVSSKSSATSLSISMPGNLSSDVSLKLSTGDGDKVGHAMGLVHSERQSGWVTGWSSSPMGGPLAEALRSSSNSESPTSVLHQLPRGSASETCIVGS